MCSRNDPSASVDHWFHLPSNEISKPFSGPFQYNSYLPTYLPCFRLQTSVSQVMSPPPTPYQIFNSLSSFLSVFEEKIHHILATWYVIHAYIILSGHFRSRIYESVRLPVPWFICEHLRNSNRCEFGHGPLTHTLEWGFKIPLASYTISCAFVCCVLKRNNLW
jgi:hypothetical protein